MFARFVLTLFTLALCCGCSSTPANQSDQPPASDLYGSKYSTIVIEAAYATGMEPYTGRLFGLGDSWQLFQVNAARIFEKSPKKLVIPTTLTEMERIDVTGTTFTTDQILAIADAHRHQRTSGSTATFYVVWLPGHLVQDGRVNDQVLGVSIGNTGVIAMFKEVIRSVADPSEVNVERFVEQSTLVHEFGHAVGLVDNGVAMTSSHLDSAHGAHCTNTRCTMYWENEGPMAAARFVRQLVRTGTEVLFGPECLHDVDAPAK
jgi:hypothetical protein